MPAANSRHWPVVASLLLSCAAATAAEIPPRHADELSKAVRESLAAAHQRMAECLRSERKVQECEAEMDRGGKVMGRKKCPMMQPDSASQDDAHAQPHH